MRAISLLAILSVATAAPIDQIEQRGVVTTLVSALTNKYIVTFKSGTSDSAQKSLISALTTAPDLTYSAGPVLGFAGTLTAAQVTALKADPNVLSVVADELIQGQGVVSQAGSQYGLARISHKTTGTSYGTSYEYDSTAGAGTCAYIIDTGVYAAHADFEGRATQVKSFIDGATTDDNGHGTHVAGIVGSKTYGVAKKTKLFGVKVLDSKNSGKVSQIIAGINWAANDAKAARSDGRCPKGTVASVSLGTSSQNAALNAAAKAAVESGLFLAVAAGNAGYKDNYGSPASEPTVCTVSAIDNANKRASFSNWGASTDIWAPGNAILSTYNNGKTATYSGTSQAAPHIAGLAAYALGIDSSKSASSLCAYLQGTGIKNIVTDSGSSVGGNNFMAYNNNGA